MKRLPPDGAWAVIFTSRLKSPAPGYAETARRMLELVRDMPGFLGVQSARGEDGFGVTVSWWRSRRDIARWRAHPEHRKAIARAKEWYESWETRICRLPPEEES